MNSSSASGNNREFTSYRGLGYNYDYYSTDKSDVSVRGMAMKDHASSTSITSNDEEHMRHFKTNGKNMQNVFFFFAGFSFSTN